MAKLASANHILAGAFVALALLTPTRASAQCVNLRNGSLACPPAESKCVQDRYGDWFCSSPGGDAVTNRYGDPVCGAGACVKDARGDVSCSTQPRGNAAVDGSGSAVCSNGCAVATAQACKPLTK